jgi:hypothetical protein
VVAAVRATPSWCGRAKSPGRVRNDRARQPDPVGIVSRYFVKDRIGRRGPPLGLAPLLIQPALRLISH